MFDVEPTGLFSMTFAIDELDDPAPHGKLTFSEKSLPDLRRRHPFEHTLDDILGLTQ